MFVKDTLSVSYEVSQPEGQTEFSSTAKIEETALYI